MSSAEVLLYLVLVPAAIVAVIWVLAYPGGSRSPRRYRPGRPYEFSPVWYVAKPDRPGSDRPAITAGPTGPGQPDEAAAAAVAGPKGGASDRW